MVKRHTANALHIARCMGRKGYANEGAVTDDSQLVNVEPQLGFIDRLMGKEQPVSYGRAAPDQSWPSESELATSRKYDQTYGSPVAPTLTEGSTINRPSFKQTQKAFYEKTPISNPQTIDPEQRDRLETAWLAANKTALGSLGFDPRRVASSPDTGKDTTLGGFYGPKDDQVWYNERYPSAVIHESFHRGINKLKEAGRLPEWYQKPMEESIIRGMMLKHFGDIEVTPNAKEGNDQIETAKGLLYPKKYNDNRHVAERMRWQQKTNKSFPDMLSEIESLAATHLKDMSPRGPRAEGGRAGYLAGGMPEVIDLETEVPDDTSSFDSSDDSPANFFRQDKELQQARPEMFQQKTYKPYTAWEDEPAAAPARQPMAYAPSDTPSRGPAMDAISGATDSDRPNPPRPIPPGNIPNVPQAKNVDPRLFSILNAAGRNLPEGWSWNVTPSGGFRPGDPRFHGKGMAVDVQLVDDQGKPLPNYQNAAAFRAYEQFAQAARKAQLDLHPELSSQLRWGGYFSGPVGKYGAKDLMHFDLGGDRIPMGGGSWDTGLHERERRYLPGAKSVGMGNYAKGGSIADRAIMVMSRQAQSRRGRP